jgi:hypothetical protein
MSLYSQQVSNVPLGLDGLYTGVFDSVIINGQTLILNDYIKKTGTTIEINNILKIASSGSIIIQDSLGNILFQTNSTSTNLSRPQSSFTPVLSNDLVNVAYITSQLSNYISYVNTSTILNKAFKLSPGSDSFAVLDNSNIVLFSVNSSGGITLMSRAQSSYAPSIGNDLVNKTYVDSVVTSYVPYSGATNNVDLNTRTLTCGGITVNGAISSNGSITSTSSNVGGFKGIFENNLLTSAPSVGLNGGNGDRLILYRGGVSENPYSIGINSYTMWLSASGNSLTDESLFNILFYSGQRARWKMNGSSTTANLTSQQSYMNISDQNGNKLVSSASSLLLSTTSNGPILLSVNNGTSNALIVSDNFTTLDDLNVRGTFGSTSGTIIRLGNNSTLSSGYDAIEFRRSNSNPVIFCSSNYIVPFTSGLGSFTVNAKVGDMVLRTASSNAMLFSVTAGASNQLVLDTRFKLADLSNTRIESATSLLYLVINNNNAQVLSTNTTTFYDSGAPMVYLGNPSGQDQLYFLRYATTNPAIQFGDQQIGYASVAGAFIVNSAIGDICTRLNNKSFRVSTDNGSTSSLVVSATTNNVGVNVGTALGKLHVNQGFSSTPENVLDWTSINSVFSNSTGSRSAGFGITLDSNTNSAGVYLLALTPNISWNRMNFSASSFVFRVNGSPIFNISYLGTGTVYSNGGTLTNTNPSDIRLKNTIIPLTNNLDIINQLRPVSFLWNDQQKHGSKLQIGFIAQEVKKVIPVIVSEYKEPIVGPSNLVDENGMRIDECITNFGVDTMALIPFLVGGMKEQNEVLRGMNEQLVTQQATIDLLLIHMTELTNQVNNLTKKLITN